MLRNPIRTAFNSLAFSVLVVSAWCAPGSAPLSYNERIQPILAENCFHCHGADSGTRKGKLRLDRGEDAIAVRGDHEPAIVPGDIKASLLIQRILSEEEDERMPPLESHKTLTTAEVETLKRWILEGAKYEKHWSFTAPQRPAVPTVASAAPWVRNPIDGFIAEGLVANGLKPSPEEDRARLLRRVTFDLTGLPPTAADLTRFAADRAPDAYERAVDRMLASDACAEQFSRHWLDAVRYADTHGIHIDNYRSIWPYRDWVVDAYRRNLPFDQFTIEQIAGDMLPGATMQQKIASGFNRCLPTTSEGGAIAEEYEAIYAKDRVETLSAVWLGLTTGCAACHDHKFDPITQRDFYSLTAFFRNNTMMAMDGNRSDPPPTLVIPANAADGDRLPVVTKAIAEVRERLKARVKDGEPDLVAWLSGSKTLLLPPPDHAAILTLPLNTAGESIPTVRGKTTTTVATPRDGVVDGPFGPAAKIDGLDLVVGASIPWMNDGAEGYAFLIRTSGSLNGTLLSCSGENEGSPGWRLFFEQGKLGLSISSGSGTAEIRDVSTTAFVSDTWQHLVVSFDASSPRARVVEVFLDGRSVLNSGLSSRLEADIVPQAPLRIGSVESAHGGPAAMLSGGSVWMQDFRRYSRGFAAGEVKTMAGVLDAYRALAIPADQRTLVQETQLRQHFYAAVDKPSLTLLCQLTPLLSEERAIRARGQITLVMEEKKDSVPFAHVLNRGEYSQPTDKVPAATPGMLPGLPAGVPADRLALARWLVAPENPLTARVTVNRVWQDFLGTGLVESSGDFGVMGNRPSHPHLLDWLAVEFRESGWDFKKLVRLIVTSATYRQSARVTPDLLERDPGNRWLAHGPRLRLDAEQLRDQALAASELLVTKLHGPPTRPYQPEGIWEEVAMKESTTRFYHQDSGDDLYRRSLYTMWKRTAAPPAMEILNAPTREVACVRRDRTNTPLQALVTMNEPLFVESSRQLASRALHASPQFDARLDLISVRLMGRTFVDTERAVLKRTFDVATKTYRDSPELAAELLKVGDSPVDSTLPAPELAAWTLLASQVMNLDESLTK